MQIRQARNKQHYKKGTLNLSKNKRNKYLSSTTQNLYRTT